MTRLVKRVLAQLPCIALLGMVLAMGGWGASSATAATVYSVEDATQQALNFPTVANEWSLTDNNAGPADTAASDGDTLFITENEISVTVASSASASLTLDNLGGAGDLDLILGANTLTLSGLTVGDNWTLNVTSTTGSLILNGAMTLSVTAASMNLTANGNTGITINAGQTLTLKDITVAADQSLTIAGAGNLVITGTVTLGQNATLNLDGMGTNVDASTASLSAAGAGTSTLQVPANNSLTLSALTVADGNVLNVTASGTGTLAVSTTITFGTGTLTLPNLTVANGGAMTVTGTGTLSIASALVVSAGALTLPELTVPDNTTLAVSGAGTLVVTNALTLNATGANTTTLNLTNATSPLTVGTLTTSGDGSSAITLPAGKVLALTTLTVGATNALVMSGTGTLTVASSPISTGAGLTIPSLSIAGTMAIQGSGALTVSGAVTLAAAAVLDLNSLAANSSAGITLSGAASVNLPNSANTLSVTSFTPGANALTVNLGTNAASGINFSAITADMAITVPSANSGVITLPNSNTLTINNLGVAASQTVAFVGAAGSKLALTGTTTLNGSSTLDLSGITTTTNISAIPQLTLAGAATIAVPTSASDKVTVTAFTHANNNLTLSGAGILSLPTGITYDANAVVLTASTVSGVLECPTINYTTASSLELAGLGKVSVGTLTIGSASKTLTMSSTAYVDDLKLNAASPTIAGTAHLGSISAILADATVTTTGAVGVTGDVTCVGATTFALGADFSVTGDMALPGASLTVNGGTVSVNGVLSLTNAGDVGLTGSGGIAATTMDMTTGNKLTLGTTTVSPTNLVLAANATLHSSAARTVSGNLLCKGNVTFTGEALSVTGDASFVGGTATFTGAVSLNSGVDFDLTAGDMTLTCTTAPNFCGDTADTLTITAGGVDRTFTMGTNNAAIKGDLAVTGNVQVTIDVADGGSAPDTCRIQGGLKVSEQSTLAFTDGNASQSRILIVTEDAFVYGLCKILANDDIRFEANTTPGGSSGKSPYLVATDATGEYDGLSDATLSVYFSEPDGVGDAGNTDYRVVWEMTTPSTSTGLTLYYTGERSSTGLTEIVSLTGVGTGTNGYTWDLREVPPGSYYIYAAASANTQTATNFSEGKLTVQEHDPVLTIITPDAATSLLYEPPTAPAKGVTVSDTLTITFRGVDPDPSGAFLWLYYDTEYQTRDGWLINAEPASGHTSTFTLDVSDVPTGDYFIYGKITEGDAGATAVYVDADYFIRVVEEGETGTSADYGTTGTTGDTGDTGDTSDSGDTGSTGEGLGYPSSSLTNDLTGLYGIDIHTVDKKTTYGPGDRFRLNVSLTAENKYVDVYLLLILPDGLFVFLGPDFTFGAPWQAQPVLSRWMSEPFENITLFDFVIQHGFPTGSYSFYMAMCPSGADFWDYQTTLLAWQCWTVKITQ